MDTQRQRLLYMLRGSGRCYPICFDFADSCPDVSFCAPDSFIWPYSGAQKGMRMLVVRSAIPEVGAGGAPGEVRMAVTAAWGGDLVDPEYAVVLLLDQARVDPAHVYGANADQLSDVLIDVAEDFTEGDSGFGPPTLGLAQLRASVLESGQTRHILHITGQMPDGGPEVPESALSRCDRVLLPGSHLELSIPWPTAERRLDARIDVSRLDRVILWLRNEVAAK